MSVNENHRRHLVATFQHVDDLLSESERILASAGSASPFRDYAPDSTPLQRKVTQDYIARIRQTMRRFLDELGIPPKPPICGALWAVRGNLDFISIALADLDPAHMRGYGQFSAEDEQRFASAVAELNAAIGRIKAFLAHGAEHDLQARLARLESTTDEVRLLRELDRIVTAHGLVEFRGTLATLLERLENHVFEIGVFGRVSSGKSSLLNHLFGSEVLPVGVTPVTSFPTRVSLGATAQAVVEFVDSSPRTISIAQLAEFCTEQQNPDNRKHVARIQVQIPSAQLREGVTFVDTPGLGSLATAGAEETVAYLPRCDLGIVLIDAASTLTHEDLVVMQALGRSGAKAMVLVSKADLLGEAERRHTIEYVRRQMATQANLDLPVHLVSVVGQDVRLCDDWLQNELMPLVVTHREQAAAALKRKVGALREAVVKVLERRLRPDAETRTRAAGRGDEDALASLRMADAQIEAAERDGNEILDDVAALADEILRTIAADLAAAWANRVGEAADPRGTAVASIGRLLTIRVTRLTERLAALRSQLEQTLSIANKALPTGNDMKERLPIPAGAPVADATSLTQGLALRRPPLLSWLGAGPLQRRLRQQLGARLGEALPGFLGRYRAQLREWLRQSLAELRTAFAARADVYRAQLDLHGTSSAVPGNAANLRTDLQVLQEWPA